MSPVSWIPKRTLQDDILEEELRIAELEQGKQWVAPVRTQQMVQEQPPETFNALPSPMPTETIPQWKVPQEEFAPISRIPKMGTIIPELGTTAPQMGIPAQKMEQIEQKAPWEMPAVWTETAMQKVGEAVSKVPLLPKALQFVAPAFQWIHENLETPFASMLSPILGMPSLPWKVGESWIEHQKRSYEVWNAPTYLKGLLEFAMPLWWIPYFGWAAKGAKAVGAGERIMQGIATAEKISGIPVKMISLPADKLLNDVMFKSNMFKTFAQWGEHMPGVKQAIQVVGGPGVFVKADSPLPLDIAKRSYVKNLGQLRSMGGGIERQITPHLQVLGNERKVLGITAEGKLTNIIPKDPKSSQYLGDVIEGALNEPGDYVFLSKAAKEYVDTYRTGLDIVNKFRTEGGLKVPKEYKYHRMVEGKWFDGKLEKSEFGSRFEDPRVHEKMADAIVKPDPVTGKLNGIAYGLSPTESLSTTVNHYITQVATKRFNDEVGTLGKTVATKWAETFPNEAKQINELTKTLSSTKYADSAMKRIASYKGTTLPGTTIRKIREEIPEVGGMIDRALDITMPQLDITISRMGAEIRQLLKIDIKEFKIRVANAEGEHLLTKVENVLLSDVKDKIVAERMIEKIYKQAARLKKMEYQDALKAVRGSIDGLLSTTKSTLKPLLGQRREFFNHYRGSSFFGNEAKFMGNPAFKDKIFPTDVVRWVQKKLDDQSQQWLKSAASISGLSRMLTATLDFSSKFIQGASVIGANPVAWAQAAGKMYQFAWQPKKFLEYLTDPTVSLIRAERAAAGSSLGGFEFFQALKPTQRLVEGIPKVGGVAQKTIQQIFGRADVVFEGFGEVARNKMWVALKKPGASPEQLMNLARTLDRMTGLMSTSAIGIGKTQQDIENAFVFFSPRYTRAGMSFIADTLQGGISGKVARESMVNFLQGGFAMYYGTCKALGQQPNFDPSSGRFLTVKIGDQHLGVGGISVALMRLVYDVGVTAVEDPMNLVKPFNESGVNRWDNPFIRFMYSRTAPLTSMGIGAVVEQANYYGQPFETIGDWAGFVADKVTPIALQSVGEAGLIGTAGQVMGLRQFPLSPWEVLQNERDRLAKTGFGMTYDILNDLQKKQVDVMPTTMKLQDEIDAQTVQRGDAESMAFLNRKREMDSARTTYVDRLNQLQQAHNEGAITAYDFREEMSNAGIGLGAVYDHINKQPEYQAILKKLQSGDLSDKSRFDMARIEFAARSSSPEMEDQYGIFDFKKYDALSEEIQKKYGEDAWQYVLQYKAEKDKELPPLAQEYQKAKQVLKPYWEIEDKVIEQFGEPKTAYAERYIAKLVSKLRKRMRQAYPEIDRMYKLFYTQT